MTDEGQQEGEAGAVEVREDQMGVGVVVEDIGVDAVHLAEQRGDLLGVVGAHRDLAVPRKWVDCREERIPSDTSSKSYPSRTGAASAWKASGRSSDRRARSWSACRRVRPMRSR